MGVATSRQTMYILVGGKALEPSARIQGKDAGAPPGKGVRETPAQGK
jgi:hypothetical protein